MLKILAFGILFCSVVLNVCGKEKISCENLYSVNIVHFKQQSIKEFDQTKNSGWRSLTNKRCYNEAAKAILEYMISNKTVYYLEFHAAQQFAMANDYKEAVKHLDKSIRNNLKADFPLKWNEYVLGVKAFLSGNNKLIPKYKEQILNGKKFFGNTNNSAVLQKLIENPNKTYREIFEK